MVLSCRVSTPALKIPPPTLILKLLVIVEFDTVKFPPSFQIPPPLLVFSWPSSIVTPEIAIAPGPVACTTPKVTEQLTPVHWAWITDVAAPAPSSETELEPSAVARGSELVRTSYTGPWLFGTEFGSGTLTTTAPLMVAASVSAARSGQSPSEPGVQFVPDVVSLASLTVMVVTAPAGPAASVTNVSPRPAPAASVRREIPATNRPHTLSTCRPPQSSVSPVNVLVATWARHDRMPGTGAGPGTPIVQRPAPGPARFSRPGSPIRDAGYPRSAR